MRRSYTILLLFTLFFGLIFSLHSQTPVPVWKTGSDAINQQTLLINSPGARYSSCSWTDTFGNLWQFGGIAYDKNGVLGRINDLWRYDPTAEEWTWMAGSDIINQAGIYGTKGIGSTTNIPGARADPNTWIDGSGNFWLFGGSGYDKNGANGQLNDLWKYAPATGEWTWIAGSDVKSQYGNYGTKGIGSTANIPGGRYRSVSWVDDSGNFWLFGGQGYAKSGFTGDLNDLWQFNLATKEWTWMAGSDVISQPSIFGTKGTGNTTNIPGARHYAVSWSDGTGNFWLFGGSGKDKNDLNGRLNELWRYEPTNGKWTWMAGSDVVNQAGIYGVLGTGSITNIPGARMSSISWSDITGNFWLLGGSGIDKNGATGQLNDLWKYAPTTGEWTWIEGGDIIDQPSISGIKGTASTANIVGARSGGISWNDGSGNLWLSGGYGYDLMGALGILNDLWKYNATTGEWAWIAGSDTRDRQGVYGTIGTGSNTPGAREHCISWTDGAGSLWLFGGYGNDINGIAGNLNDLWRYNPATGEWTWIAGSDAGNQSGIYGTKGNGNKDNIPGARNGSISWTDSSGNLWLFGGSGIDKNGLNGWLNDLWKYEPTNRKWTWIAGSDVINQAGTYGTKGSGSTTYIPGARNGSVSWTDGLGNLFLFGGYGIDISASSGRFNDLWSFNTDTKQWTWLAGNDALNQPGNYGTKGIGSEANTPGGRYRSVSCVDNSGNLWLFGGEGYDKLGSLGYLNDLWQYNPATGQWTWVAGSDNRDEPGIYGTKGISSTTNIPGARNDHISWIDASGALWLFGGEAIDINDWEGYINDLWRYDRLTGEWTWIAGSDTIEQPGFYGTKGTGSTANIPGARISATSWTDDSGKLWLFGGYGIDKNGLWGRINDLWQIEFIPGALDALLLHTVDQYQIEIKWLDDTWATNYRVDVSNDNFNSLIEQLTITDTFHIISGLDPGTQYFFRVKSTNNLGESPYSDTLVVLTKPETPVLNAITSADITQTMVTISWPVVSGIVDEYLVDVSSTNFSTPTLIPGYPLTVTGSSLNIGADAGTSPLISGSNYWFRLRSRNNSGESPDSNVEAIIMIPANPTANAATSILSTSFQASWNQISGANYYILEVSSNDFATLTLRDSISGQLLASVTGLSPNTEYKYRVRAGNISGVSGYSNVVTMTTPFTEAESPIIPFERFGGTDQSWNLFSIPYELVDKSISTIFADYDASRHEFDWRIVRYRNSSNDYVNYNTGQVKIGEAYWFNAKENITVSVGAGQINSQVPFTVPLAQGWNLIGNPYPLNISWEQVILDNPTITGVESLQVFNGRTQLTGDIMKPFGGGFVWSDQTVPVFSIDPRTANTGGRIATNTRKIESDDIDWQEWMIDINLETNDIEEKLGGFGMHPDASMLKDRYDEMAVPRFMVYTDLSTEHNDYFYPWFATDVVPTSANYIWSFTLASNESHATTLKWNQATLQGKEARLYLLDKSSGNLLDMKLAGSHIVDLSNGDFKFDIYFITGDDPLLPTDLILGRAYPNPANTHTTIPVVLPGSLGDMKINLSIYNINGKLVKTLADGVYTPGIYDFTWNVNGGTQQNTSGMFIYRLQISNSSIPPIQKKLIIR